jgi:hypothetical protein
MSGVLIRQINNDHQIRSKYSTENRTQQLDLDSHHLQKGAEAFARTLAKEQRSDRLEMALYRAENSTRTKAKAVSVWPIDREATRHRTRYYVDGLGTLYCLEPRDSALRVVCLKKLYSAERRYIAEKLGTTLPIVD